MLPCRVLIVCLFYCCIRVGVRTSKQALFPAASRAKRGAEAGGKLTFQNSLEDVNLLYEILLAGTRFETSGEFSVHDAELASMRKTKNLEVICEEIIPRTLIDIVTLISNLSSHTGDLHPDDFEHILLTLVFTAQQMASSNEQQREMWAESFVSLYKAIKQDLTGKH
ncbi:protein FAM180A-like [Notolabrus celidotus]|uniref:protein FAM180A-like n=1 Tax=Notolabrus celidotus TaxID=1203425 RepID=UPI00148FB9CF|nr:protein FAM180A-like [Notolabrus celidotus]